VIRSPPHSRVARRIAHAHTSSRFSRRGACGGGAVDGGGRRARDPWLRVLLGGQSPLTHAGRARRTPGGPPHRNNHVREIPRRVRENIRLRRIVVITFPRHNNNNNNKNRKIVSLPVA